MTSSDSKQRFQLWWEQLSENSPAATAADAAVWDQLGQEQVSSVQEVFSLLSPKDIRKLKDSAPENLSKLCFKLVEKITDAVESSCRSSSDQQTVINCSRFLTRIIPYIFEDPDWNNFFWSSPDLNEASNSGPAGLPLAKTLLFALSDLLFCPDFTVSSSRNKSRDEVDELVNIDSCEYIWEKGVGCAQSMVQVALHHHTRQEMLRLLLTCFSECIYQDNNNSGAVATGRHTTNRWVQVFTSHENRHTLPLFTSLLNTVCGYHPSSVLPYNHLLWADSKEKLVETALQVLIVTLDDSSGRTDGPSDNLFLNYLSRIHRDEDFQFILSGITRLLMNPLTQTYLPGSQKKVHFHQELLIIFWKLCEHNRKFLFHVLKSSDVLEIVIPVLNYLNDARVDQSKSGLMHIGVFILLLLSGERNFGVRLNKPYTAAVPMDISVFSGSHADLLIIVFHKIITTGHQRLQPLFECLLTILCNISPYLKTMSMTAACKLMHLVEAFSTPWFLMANKTNHNLVFFLLEMLNNLIQYQFDGNSNLAYTMIRKRNVFHQLANLPTDCSSIHKTVSSKRSKKPLARTSSTSDDKTMEGAQPAMPAEPGTLNTSLMKFPKIENLTEGVSAHPSQRQLDKLTQSLQGTSLEPTKAMTEEIKPVQPEAGAEYPDNSSVADLLNPAADEETNQVEDRGKLKKQNSTEQWRPTTVWLKDWKSQLPLQTIMRMLQVLVPQVEKMCIDKGLTDESEILRFLQNGTLVGLLPVPHPILIRRYQANHGTDLWFRTYMWGIVYLRNNDPAVWIDTNVKMFTVQKL